MIEQMGKGKGLTTEKNLLIVSSNPSFSLQLNVYGERGKHKEEKRLSALGI